MSENLTQSTDIVNALIVQPLNNLDILKIGTGVSESLQTAFSGIAGLAEASRSFASALGSLVSEPEKTLSAAATALGHGIAEVSNQVTEGISKTTEAVVAHVSAVDSGTLPSPPVVAPLPVQEPGVGAGR